VGTVKLNVQYHSQTEMRRGDCAKEGSGLSLSAPGETLSSLTTLATNSYAPRFMRDTKGVNLRMKIATEQS